VLPCVQQMCALRYLLPADYCKKRDFPRWINRMAVIDLAYAREPRSLVAHLCQVSPVRARRETGSIAAIGIATME
jgi:hypothetical protein